MAGGQDDDAFEAEQELALADANERLPWLESDDDEEEGQVDTGRLVAFAIILTMALVIVLGGLWYFTREKPDGSLAASGDTIAAPPGPYKVKPANPGGREVAGTGDTSFEVAEGHQVDARIAESPAPGPSISTAASASPSPSPKPSASASASSAPSGAVGVQVGAYSSKAQAETGWTQLSGRLAPLKGHSHRVVEGTADSGTVFRLQALAGNAAEADALCRAIKSAGGDCQVKR
jgi:cell division protein FtsN